MDSGAYLLIKITSPERIESLNRFLTKLREAKQQRSFPSDDEWQRYVDEKTRSYFWEPSPEELKAWQKEWFSTPVENRHQIQAVSWSFGSLLETLKNGEFLVEGLQITGSEGKLFFEPLAHPFGGVNGLIAVIEAFGQKVVGFDDGMGFTPYYSFREAPLSERMAILNAELITPVKALLGYSKLLEQRAHEHDGVTDHLKRFSQELSAITDRLNATWQTARTSPYSEAALQKAVSEFSLVINELFGQLQQINSVAAEISKIFPEIPDLSQKFWQNAKHVWTTIKVLTDPDI